MSETYPTGADGYELLSKIGTGAFATVYAARVVEGPNREELVAIKVLELDDEETNWDEIRKEIAVMKNLDHENVVRSYCSFIVGDKLWLVMPLLDGGSCADLLRNSFQRGFHDEALVASILKETLQGLDYFHQDGKIHRDIKAGNILLAADGGVKIADFGVSGALIDVGLKREVRKTFTGTPCWMAPEVMEQAKGHNYKADIWSFGITALELAYGRPPYAKYRPMKVMLMILQEDPPSTNLYENAQKFSSDFKKMVDACLRKDPKDRPNAQKLLSYKIFKKAKGKAYIKRKLSKHFTNHTVEKPKQHAEPHALQEQKPKQKPVSVQSFVFDEENEDKKHSNESDSDVSPAESQPVANGVKRDISPSSAAQSEKRGRFTVETDLYGNSEVDDSEPVSRGRFRVSSEET